jgi:hypothetical protein
MVELKLYEEPHLGIFHDEDESKRVDLEERSILIPSCPDDFVHLGRLKWDVGCSHIKGDLIYEID